jgi:hypothetical protein
MVARVPTRRTNDAIIVAKAADGPVLFVPNESTIHRLTAGAEPRELAISYKQLLATVSAAC